MNMSSELPLREAPIPPPPPAAEPPLTDEAADRIHAALLNLLWLAVYLAVMRLFGYRLSRPARQAPRAKSPAPAEHPPIQTAPPAKRPRTAARTIDRAMCLAMFERINAAVATPRPPAAPQPESAAVPAAPSARPHARPARPAHPRRRAPISPRIIPQAGHKQRPHPRPPPKNRLAACYPCTPISFRIRNETRPL
jgi:hypothetical protein